MSTRRHRRVPANIWSWPFVLQQFVHFARRATSMKRDTSLRLAPCALCRGLPSSELRYSSALMQKPLPAWADSRGLRASANRTTTLTWSMKSEMNVPDSISRSIFTRCAEPSNMQSSARHSGLSLQQRCFQQECCSVFSRKKWMCVGLA